MLKFNESFRIVKKEDLSDFERGTGCWWGSVFWYFHADTTISRVYRACSNIQWVAVEENVLLIWGVRGQRGNRNSSNHWLQPRQNIVSQQLRQWRSLTGHYQELGSQVHLTAWLVSVCNAADAWLKSPTLQRQRLTQLPRESSATELLMTISTRYWISGQAHNKFVNTVSFTVNEMTALVLAGVHTITCQVSVWLRGALSGEGCESIRRGLQGIHRVQTWARLNSPTFDRAAFLIVKLPTLRLSPFPRTTCRLKLQRMEVSTTTPKLQLHSSQRCWSYFLNVFL